MPKDDEPPHPWLVFGPGRMGNYATLQEAHRHIEQEEGSRLGPSALYIRVDVAVALGMNATIYPPIEAC